MSSLLVSAIVFILLAAAVLVLVLAVDRGDGVERRVAHRLDRIALASRPIIDQEIEVRRADDRRSDSLDRLFSANSRQVSHLRQRLTQASIPLSVTEFLLGCLVLSAIVAGGLALFGAPGPLAVATGTTAGFGLPYVVAGYLQGRRAKKFLAVFPEALDLIVRGLRAGIPVSEAIGSIGQEVSEPVAGEFRTIADQLRIGQTMDEAMTESVDRVGIEDYRFFVISLAIQRETGGNLSETLSNLSDIIRRRQELRLKVRALSSEARASAIILGALPFLTAGILSILNPEYIRLLVDDPFGHVLLGGAATMLTLGVLSMWRMINFEI